MPLSIDEFDKQYKPRPLTVDEFDSSVNVKRETLSEQDVIDSLNRDVLTFMGAPSIEQRQTVAETTAPVLPFMAPSDMPLGEKQTLESRRKEARKQGLRGLDFEEFVFGEHDPSLDVEGIPSVQIPRIPAEKAVPGRKLDVAFLNALLGGAELAANFPLFPAQIAEAGQAPVGEPSMLDIISPEGKLQVPEIAEELVRPAAKLAAGITTRKETKAGRELFEEAVEESIERPETVALPFLMAAGGAGAARRALPGKARRGKISPVLDDITKPVEPKPRVKAVPRQEGRTLRDLAELEKVKEEFPGEAKPLPIKKAEVTARAERSLLKPKEQSVWRYRDDLKKIAKEANKFKDSKDFADAYTQRELTDLSDQPRHRWGRVFSDEPDILTMRETGQYMEDLGYAKETYPVEYSVIASGQSPITIYRAVPKSTKGNKIQLGDYVALDRKYAKEHGESTLHGDYKIISNKVFPGEVLWDGNDFSEWIYSPRKIRNRYGDLEGLHEGLKQDFPDLAPRKPLPIIDEAIKPKPVGEPAEATLAIRTEADAIAKKLTDDFGDLPQYKTMNMADQAKQAQDIIAKDYAQAKRMAMGEEPPPAGLREASIYEGVKLRALKEGDVQTLMELATESEIPTKLSEYGQAIKAADSEIINDPVRTMQDIAEVRKQRAERTGKKATDTEVERLRGELETLQKALDTRVSRVTGRKPAKYGSKNKIVDQTAYDKAKAEIARSIGQLGANPFANPEIIANTAKIGAYHLEAGTRVFADWSARMVSDLGENVKPHLKDLWKQINTDKKLRTALKAQKTRLAKETEILTGKLETLDLTKPERRKLKLDKEAKELKRQRDRAKENLEAARGVSGTITKTEAQNIVKLSDITEKARIKMEQGGDRLEYGTARVIQERYTNDLKGEGRPIKTMLRERGQEFKKTFKEHPSKAVFDVGKDTFDQIMDNSIAMVASWDNSFIGRQGLNTLMTHPTVWAKAARNSFVDFAKTLGGKKPHDALLADIYSRENFRNGNYQKAKILTRAEEEVPTALPQRIPILGRVFKASENAFMGSGIRMRTGVFDLLNKIAKENGVDVTSKVHLEDMGTLINSLTARGKLGKLEGSRFIRIAMWAPKMLKGNWDVLTGHTLGAGLKTPFARKQAATNIMKIVAETAVILKIADTLVPGSVEWNPQSSAFGAIKIGDTRIDITAGKKSIVTLAARLLTNERKNLAGKTTEYSPGFGKRTRFDALSDFLVNKTPPPTRAVVDWLRDRDFEGDPFTPSKAITDIITPITVQQAIDLNDNASADRVAGVILDAIGVSSFSIDLSDNKSSARAKIRQALDAKEFKAANELRLDWNKRHPDNPIGKITPTEALKRQREAKEKAKPKKEETNFMSLIGL